MDSPNSNFQERDLTTTAVIPAGGVSGVLVQTLGGPIGNSRTLFTSWEQFRRVYGGFSGNNDIGVMQVKRALEGGSALRISRLTHFTDIDDPDSYDADFAEISAPNIFSLDSDLSAGNILTLTDGTKTITQAFAGDHSSTMRAFIAKVNSQNGTGISAFRGIYQMSSRKIAIIPFANTPNLTLTVTGGTAVVITETNPTAIKNSNGDTLFSVVPKYPGAYYNNLVLTIKNGSNGQSGYFDVIVDLIGSGFEPEVYKNVYIPNKAVASSYSFLKEMAERSKWVNPVYLDLSAITGTTVPIEVMLGYNNGTDGSALVTMDYIGSTVAKNGFHSFDGYDDLAQVAVLSSGDLADGIHIGGADYADSRKDLQYFAFIEAFTEEDAISKRMSIAADTSYVMFFSGNILVVNPVDSSTISIPSLGDILGLAATTERAFGLWYSFSGPNRGVIRNALGIDNEWGSKGNLANLNSLANHQINVVINRNNAKVLWGSFTGQIKDSQLSFANVRRYFILLKKLLGPVIDQFLEEPCDIQLAKQVYLAGKPIMDQFIPKRAIWEYRWEGDQFANGLDDLKINTKEDMGFGKYKVQIFIKNIVTLQQFQVDLVLTPTGVSFEDIILINNPS